IFAMTSTIEGSRCIIANCVASAPMETSAASNIPQNGPTSASTSPTGTYPAMLATTSTGNTLKLSNEKSGCLSSIGIVVAARTNVRTGASNRIEGDGAGVEVMGASRRQDA